MWSMYLRGVASDLDRIDSSKGYIIDNVQWVHKDVNLMKLSHSKNTFIQICNQVSNHSMNKNVTIAIWGGTGFIGSVLVPALLDAGYKVIVFDNFFKPVDSLLIHFNNPNFQLVELDVTKENEVIKAFKYEFEYMILLAGIVGVPACNKHHTLATVTNDIGWGYVAKHKPKDIKLLAASTGSVYGAIKDGECTEDIAVKPLSHYGITKLAGEKHVVDAGGIAYRFATAAGVSPAIRLNLLPNYMVHQAIHEKFINIFEPECMRTFIDIRDFCSSFLFGIEKFNNLKYQVYNVGDERNNWSKIQLAKYIKEKTGCFLACNETGKDNDARDYAVNYSRINSENFKCKYLIQDTIDELIKTMPHVKLDQKYW